MQPFEMAYDLDAWKNLKNIFVTQETQVILTLNSLETPTLDSIGRTNPLVPFPHRLLFLTGDNFKLLNFRFPSKFIEELIVMVHELSEKTTALRYLSAREVAQIYWRIFEHGCILTLTTASLEPLPMKQLVPPADSASSKPERWETT